MIIILSDIKDSSNLAKYFTFYHFPKRIFYTYYENYNDFETLCYFDMVYVLIFLLFPCFYIASITYPWLWNTYFWTDKEVEEPCENAWLCKTMHVIMNITSKDVS